MSTAAFWPTERSNEQIVHSNEIVDLIFMWKKQQRNRDSEQQIERLWRDDTMRE